MNYLRHKAPQDVWINGASLRGASDKICSVRLVDQSGAPEISIGGYGGRDGSLVTSHRVKSRTVKVQFGLRGVFNISDRIRALDQVNAWAADGILTWSERPGQRLTGICSHAAEIGDAFDITKTYEIEFTAYGVPFWEDISPRMLSTSGTSATESIMIPGSAATVLDAIITPSTSISTLTISAASAGKTTSMAFIDLSTSAVIYIEHTDGILTLKAGTTDISAKRTINSDDELIVYPGKVATVSISASASVAAVVSARGRWM